MSLLKEEKAKQKEQHWSEQIITSSHAPSLAPPFSLSSLTPGLEMMHLTAPNRGVSSPPSNNKYMEPSHTRGCTTGCRPPVGQWRWYSPANESSCCYGNTSHLSYLHPTLLPTSWQWWQKRSYQNNMQEREDYRGTEEKWQTHGLNPDNTLFK